MSGRPWLTLRVVHPTDARGWIAMGCYTLVLVVLAMILFDRELLESDAFLILATAIVITGWVNGPVGWAYQATKGGGELADANAAIVKKQAEASPPIAEGEEHK
jgi:cytochrome bd-type quinol oxidase subunit 1